MVNNFCDEMEGTPVKVIVGLFSAMSQRFPAFQEWDTRKHHHAFNSNGAVCDALTEVRQHVTRHGMPGSLVTRDIYLCCLTADLLALSRPIFTKSTEHGLRSL